MANERYAEYAANVLSYVAHRIEDYLPGECLLEGSQLVVRIPGMDEMPTVEVVGDMPVPVEGLLLGIQESGPGQVARDVARGLENTC